MIDSSVCYQFPWDLYILVKDKIKIPDEILKFGFNYRLFFMHLYEYVFAIRKKLRPADVKMLQYLSKYEFTDSELFYDLRKIAKFLKLDDSTIFKSLRYLGKNRMFFDILMLNPYKLGYLVKMYLYSENQQQPYKILDTYTLFKMKLSNDNILHIVTLPNTILNDLPNFEMAIVYNIKTMMINVNLDQLQAKKIESFNNIHLWEQEKQLLKPHVLFTESEYQHLYSDLSLLKNNDNNDYIRIRKYSNETQLERLTTILDYITKNYTPKIKFDNLSEQLRMNKQETIEFFHFLTATKIGRLVIQPKYIDCNARYCIVLKFTPTEEISQIIENFKQNLLLLPYTHIFESDQILAAITVLPASWAISFAIYLFLIEEAGIKVINTQIIALRSEYNLNNYKKEDIIKNLSLVSSEILN